jgi:hypothetical protein
MITNEQWELIDEKYGKLLTTICTKISGDVAIANFEDNLQDLRIACMDAVAGFSRKEGQPFESFWGTTGFNKYMKTCLWNLKNKKGAKISKRYNINKNTVDICEYAEILVADNHDTSTTSEPSIFETHKDKLGEDQQRLVSLLVDNPQYIKPNGKVNIRRASQDLGCCTAKTRKILDSIKRTFILDL